ncbi:GPR1/FUN34/yaaH family-domain-containing protein [Halteromyces radiatus]|uniref:GPR1/FUN34/yaaH family-domain-containing protein n=1 Tax=Halteromyces radiatus TaxID=101107 RepID=UPI002221265D|nr:GPR1/FUN34/yaaH family-domain-containing protein [Halteromyces radiatus]KAI8079771.1 GPR1/FUN34/yaaH family-domain-containing protein [Halteromyces radiatus]
MSNTPTGSDERFAIRQVTSENTLLGFDRKNRRRESVTSNDHLDPDFYLNRPHYADEEKAHGFTSPMLSPQPLPLSYSMDTRMVQKPIVGNFGVLALWSFATVTALLGTYDLFLPTTPNHVLLPTAVMFGGLAQVISGFFVLASGNTFGGILFVSYGTFWTGSGLMMIPAIASTMEVLTKDQADIGNGIYHFVWAFYTLINISVSLRIKGGNFMSTWNLVFVFLTLFLTGIQCVTGNLIPLRIAGVTAYLAALGAWYTGVAELFEEQGETFWLGKYHHRAMKHK